MSARQEKKTENSKKNSIYDTKNIGQFILGEKLGEGTFGKVRKGTHILTGQKVAIKILEKNRILEKADKIRVEREIKILKMLKHRYITSLYSVIQNPTTIYLIMELSQGKELFDLIVKRRRLDECEAATFLYQILSAVSYLHSINICHRDLKPENLLLNGNEGLKLVDFGLSNIIPKNQFLNTACGSPCYAAPEMLEGNKYDTGVDIWSCGIILYAMVCGYLPFEDKNNDVLYKKIKEGKFALPSFVSESCKDLIRKILVTNPMKRYKINEIFQHPWLRVIEQSPFDGLNIALFVIPIDEDIVKKMEKYGFSKEETRLNVLLNKHNQFTTTYYLLLKGKLKEGERSVSDLKSDLFIKYLKDPVNLISNYNDDMEMVIKERNKSNPNLFLLKKDESESKIANKLLNIEVCSSNMVINDGCLSNNKVNDYDYSKKEVEEEANSKENIKEKFSSAKNIKKECKESKENNEQKETKSRSSKMNIEIDINKLEEAAAKASASNQITKLNMINKNKEKEIVNQTQVNSQNKAKVKSNKRIKQINYYNHNNVECSDVDFSPEKKSPIINKLSQIGNKENNNESISLKEIKGKYELTENIIVINEKNEADFSEKGKFNCKKEYLGKANEREKEKEKDKANTKKHNTGQSVDFKLNRTFNIITSNEKEKKKENISYSVNKLKISSQSQKNQITKPNSLNNTKNYNSSISKTKQNNIKMNLKLNQTEIEVSSKRFFNKITNINVNTNNNIKTISNKQFIEEVDEEHDKKNKLLQIANTSNFNNNTINNYDLTNKAIDLSLIFYIEKERLKQIIKSILNKNGIAVTERTKKDSFKCLKTLLTFTIDIFTYSKESSYSFNIIIMKRLSGSKYDFSYISSILINRLHEICDMNNSKKETIEIEKNNDFRKKSNENDI